MGTGLMDGDGDVAAGADNGLENSVVVAAAAAVEADMASSLCDFAGMGSLGICHLCRVKVQLW